jgi:N-methylhydantoinase A/oxoprolinase/acetone carboxylase beta subunit
VGLLCSSEQRDLVRTWPTPNERDGLEHARQLLAAEAAALIEPRAGRATVEVRTTVDCRYAGQSHELSVDEVDDFHEVHLRRNGYEDRDAPVEVVAIRATARLPSGLQPTDLPPPERQSGVGPTVIVEPDCTVWLPDGWRAEPGPTGALMCRRIES